MATPDQRNHIFALQTWLIEHRTQVSYLKLRPMVTAHMWEQQLATLFNHGGIIRPDCSELQTMVCRMAGLRDPNGNGYDGDGWSGDMWSYLKHYTDPLKAGVGALVVFGADGAEHVCAVRVPGADPVLFNHGSTNGPGEINLSVLVKALNNAPFVFCDISGL